MTLHSTTTLNRRRRIAAVALALPLSLAMTGSAFATGGVVETPSSGNAAEARTAALVAPSASGGSAAADKAAADKAAADKVAADKPTQAAAAPKPERSTAGSAAGSAAGAATATSTGSTYVNGNTNSSKAERPTAPVPGTPSQPLSNADKNGTGANTGTEQNCATNNAYCSNGTGLPTGNGKGDGAAVGQPCAGCVGKADNKNPKGQAPSGPVDRNNGYECDGNQGIGQTNPAHTGCTTSTPTTPPTTPPFDACPNLTGNQPAGTDCNPGGGNGGGGGDFCPDMPGKQPAGTDCNPGGGNGGGGGDFCPDMPGKQPAGTNCNPGGGNGGGNGDFCPDGSPMPAGGKKDCNNGGGNGNNDKITICHATGSEKNPYVVITIDRNGLNGHGDHEGDIIPAPAGGCPSGSTPPQDVCPNLDGIQVPGTPCNNGGGNNGGGNGGGGGNVPLCPNGAVMPGGNPANCPTTTPVCPTTMPVVGPVQAGCQPVPPTQGGGGTDNPVIVPIDGVTPDQGAVNPIVTTPVVNVPAPMGPQTGIRPNGTQPQIITGLPTAPSRARAVPSALPFTGTEAALLIELGALLLLAGGGIAVAARRERTARAA